MEKSKEHIKTYSGIYFNPLQIKTEHIAIEDIAHSLSLQCRGGGHIRRFFSVGQHSINCAREAFHRGYSHRVQLACLLHDASEAYLSDITRPVKRQLKEYMEIEEVVQGTVWEAHFQEPLNGEEREQVQEIDEVMLYHELFHLLEEQLEVEEPPLFGELDLDTRHFEEVEEHFLQLYKVLREELERC